MPKATVSPPLKLHVSCYTTDEQKRKIGEALQSASTKGFVSAFTTYGIVVGLGCLTFGGLVKLLPDVMDTVFRIIGENGALGKEYCPVCGNLLGATAETPCEIEGMKIKIDADCVGKLNAAIRAENKALQETPDNCLKGFLGALIGGAVGAGVAAIIYNLGYISCWSAIIAILLGSFLYQKFGGKPSGKMIVIVSLTTVVCMLLSVFVCYLVAAGMAAAEEGINMGAFEAFAFLMEADEEFARYFAVDLVCMLVFSAIGVFVEIGQLRQKIQKEKQLIR